MGLQSVWKKKINMSISSSSLVSVLAHSVLSFYRLCIWPVLSQRSRFLFPNQPCCSWKACSLKAFWNMHTLFSHCHLRGPELSPLKNIGFLRVSFSQHCVAAVLWFLWAESGPCRRGLLDGGLVFITPPLRRLCLLVCLFLCKIEEVTEQERRWAMETAIIISSI